MPNHALIPTLFQSGRESVEYAACEWVKIDKACENEMFSADLPQVFKVRRGPLA